MTEPGRTIAQDDLDAIRAWFSTLNSQVNALDFAAARSSVTEDFVAFGTFSDFIVGIDDAEQNQWRNVWPKIKDFRVDVEGVRGFTSPDRLFAVGLAFFESIGFGEDGAPFDRRGRATVTFTRATADEPWVANHSHMSLLRGTPSVSHGTGQ